VRRKVCLGDIPRGDALRRRSAALDRAGPEPPDGAAIPLAEAPGLRPPPESVRLRGPGIIHWAYAYGLR
jgi:hypothetical protein